MALSFTCRSAQWKNDSFSFFICLLYSLFSAGVAFGASFAGIGTVKVFEEAEAAAVIEVCGKVR